MRITCALLLSARLCHSALLADRIAVRQRHARLKATVPRATSPRAAAAEELTEDGFAAAIAGVDRLAVVEFYAPWCRTCSAVAPRYEAFARKYQETQVLREKAAGDGVAFYKVNFKENKKLCYAERVFALPTVHFYVPHVGRVNRFTLSASNVNTRLRRELDRYMDEPEEGEASLVERLSQLRSEELEPVVRYKDVMGALKALAAYGGSQGCDADADAAAEDDNLSLVEQALGQDAGNIAHLRRLFAWLDQDGNGLLEGGELALAARALQGRGGSGGRAARLLETIEGALGGRDSIAIDRDTFVRLLTKQAAADWASPEREYLAAFGELDLDGDGAISKQELLETVGSMCDVMSCGYDERGDDLGVGDGTVAELLSAAFDGLDADDNGKIEYEEFVALMSGARPDAAEVAA